MLQEQEFERLGSNRTIRVDIRLVAATNRDLGQMVTDKQFRSDLYYRLNVFPILNPPLRERRDDIPALVQYFTQKFATRMNKRITTIPTETMAALSRYHWPGNIRELENFIERAVILTRGSSLAVPLAELKRTSHPRRRRRAASVDARRRRARAHPSGAPAGQLARRRSRRRRRQARHEADDAAVEDGEARHRTPRRAITKYKYKQKIRRLGEISFRKEFSYLLPSC